MPQTLADRLWPKVDVRGPDECWPWLAATRGGGYGMIWDNDVQRKVPAARLVYELCVGPMPAGHVPDHLCENPACCNPAHLEAVTQAINMERNARSRKTHCPAGHVLGGIRRDRTARGAIRLRRYCVTCRRQRDAAARQTSGSGY